MDSSGAGSVRHPPREGGEIERMERPFVKSVHVPESIKRRIPSKHYVRHFSCANWRTNDMQQLNSKSCMF